MGEVTKVARNYQITVPKVIRDSLHLKIGDRVSFEIKNGQGVVLSPLSMVPKHQSYYWAEKTQNALKQAENEVGKGEVKRFKSLKKMRKHFSDR